MKEKCSKYEALFTFQDEQILKQHIQNCEDCRKEQEVMDKVSDLLNEVKPYYKNKRRNFAKLKAACALFLMMTCTTALGIINFNSDFSDIIKYGTTLSAEDLGLPVDSYGLLMVE